ncbi:phospholipid carrier-dependent glycosyltransferase [Rhodococcus sp. IEGM 1379]|uniref:ArnT family glycosyltransferase n=1 Tax=Rhodococcus sp. IEGM 1379 TaxID=3047086 RepID=UPI0024B7AFF1|nr:phospholipid carrier-dependent glycosyltransferase [Rhodococcus sp. IEGM 1379]MDI9915064.1 phospholipid carrier-dependent glycosyltransferase [Rhodococcus sp. IEGM 1379]
MNAGIGFIFTDSLSRVAAVSAMLLSRDPHFAAIGFVFTPLTAAVQIPMGILGNWWPELLRWNITAVVMSAAFMAGAVIQIRGVSRDRGCDRWVTAVLTVLFAVNPMIVMYAASGMSEAPFLFFVIWAARRLMRWMHNDDVHDLIAAGLALSLAYLTRYDALAPLFVAVVLVVVVSWLRYPKAEDGDDQPVVRLWAAALDGAVLAIPGFLAFAVWSSASWLITGQAFQQFSSVYGNSAILEQSGSNVDTPIHRIIFSISEIAVLGPTLPVLAGCAIFLAIRRRDPDVVVPLALFGAVLGAQTLLYAMGSTFPLLRFYISVIPLCFVLVILIAPRGAAVISRRPGRAATAPPVTPARVHPSIPLVISLCLLAGSTAVTLVAMGNARLAVLEHSIASAVIPGRQNLEEQTNLRTFGAERRIAKYLDDLELPEGSVLLDTVESYAVVAASDHPRQFVVPSDSDFVRILNNPSEFGVEYILSVPNTGRGTSDAINRRYPTMYETGAGGVGALVLEVPNDGGMDPSSWRLYRVTGNQQAGR